MIETINSSDVAGLNEILEDVFGERLCDWVILDLTHNPKLKHSIPTDIRSQAHEIAGVPFGEKLFVRVCRT